MMRHKGKKVNYKVLIPTSGIGSRLGDLTDFTNKSLVRIGNKPALSLIIESYPIGTKFVITLGYYGQYVRQFLELNYVEYDFCFVEVSNYNGDGSSLGFSMLHTKEHLQCPFVFNACDAILLDNSDLLHAMSTGENFCIGAKRNDASQYATLLVDSGLLKEIKDKGELSFDYAYTGICGIQDYDLFWKSLEETYLENTNDRSLNDGKIINKMVSSVRFTVVEAKSWLDMGNVGELEKTREHYDCFAEVLEKKEESIYFFNDHVVKFFSNPLIVKNRVLRSKDLGGLTPEVTEYANNFYKYDKVQGNLLAHSITESSFQNLLYWAKENLWHKREVDNFKNLCNEFYVSKTNTRVNKFLGKKKDKQSFINGEKVPPIFDILDKIDSDWLCDGIPVRFHGDFILDNILETDDGFCLLDWRQDFAGNLICGDIYYDLAKLNHNLTINHEIVNRNLYNYENNDCYILCNSKLLSCKQILKRFIIENGYDYKKVEVLTSLIWINMAPLHEYPFSNFLFNFGKMNLIKGLSND